MSEWERGFRIHFSDYQLNKWCKNLVEWPNFRNFIGDNQIVMNKNKPLDQVRSTGANALNRTSKLVNKTEFNGSILDRLMDFADSVPDFRRSDKGNIRHRLADIIILMIFARECGCVGRADIIQFITVR